MKFRLFCTLLPPGRRLARAAACLLWLVLPVLHASAAEVTGLYQVSVTVASREDERERQQAFSTAMREMLVKLTGRNDTTANPVIARGLASPQPYVETWAYNSLIAADPFAQPGQAAQIGLQVTFFQDGVQQLLNEAGVAVWPQNRPETLLWVIVQDELGERFLAQPEPGDGSDLLSALQTIADRRGVPLLLPLLDFQDLRALSLEQLWSVDVEAVRAASARYGNESILVLRVFRSLRGDEVIGKAVHIFRDRVQEFEVLEAPLGPFLEGSIDLAALELAGYYAIVLSADDSSTELLLTVDGIRNLADYAGLLQYLGGLAAVNGVQVVSAAGTVVELKLRTGGQFPQLIESIALDRRMQVVGEVSRNNQQVFIHYQWLPQP